MAEVDGVHPELRRVARFLPGGYALHRGLRPQRAVMNLAVRMGRIKHIPSVAVDDHVSVRVHRPVSPAEQGPALLWIHGGAMVMGGAAQEDTICRKLAKFAGVSVVSVEHRLAPEHPYPAALEDCYAALLWLIQQSWVDPARVAIGGVSGGGGLAAALALLARERGTVTPVLQLLVYPMLDDRTGAGTNQPRRLMWSGRDNQIAWHWYLGGADPTRAVPARRDDLAGLPPAWIGVGSLDLFHDECVEYGRWLREAGVPAHVEVAPGGFHTFDMLAPNASVSQRFFASQVRALRTALCTEDTVEEQH